MNSFRNYLDRLAHAEPLSADDALAVFLPLARAALGAHQAGGVAPLEGIERLILLDSRLAFAGDPRLPCRDNLTELNKIEAAERAVLDVVAESRVVTVLDGDDEDGDDRYTRLELGAPGEPTTRPVYLPGYVTWEHALAHHDPLTDIFSLGMILASLALRLDFRDERDLERFVVHRRNPFAIHAELHPVIARAIRRMTELDRRRRDQDLAELVNGLERYREQGVDFTLDLARVPGFRSRDARDRREIVLGKLQERLFDLSRRNSLLHFRPSLSSIDLTQASMPLSFDPRLIPADRILTWNDDLRKSLAAGRPLRLDKYLNFSEAVYLPSLLDRLIADARRDQAELGFSQVRLAICFLSWANLKTKPIERYESPLLLLRVQLVKNKGVRDTYALEPLSSEAEINPVLRRMFKQLYAIETPETIDLAEAGVDSFVDWLTAKIQASEPAITVHRLDRPRVELIHEKARRRLDRYRQSARGAKRGTRVYFDLEYSYDPSNYQPLGVKLYNAMARAPSTRLREIVAENPRPREHRISPPAAEGSREPSAAGPVPKGPSPADESVIETERSFLRLKGAAEENPYIWNIDFCALTLAQFRYRKMTLVRDYEALIADRPENPAFESIFSLAPRPAHRELPNVGPLADRRDVVSCDPTQATAIAEARRGVSYIIQGPPGTGKSQTITNLIADFVGRGARVLFVCEKRAAIDVVFARLRQCGLAPLCSLIHDSQADKKEFVLDLKRTYESFLEAESSDEKSRIKSRQQLLEEIGRELAPLERFERVMQADRGEPGSNLRHLLDRAIALRRRLPTLSDDDQGRLVDYSRWTENRDRLDRFVDALRVTQPDGVLAHHPLRRLSTRWTESDRSIEDAKETVRDARESLDWLIRAWSKSPVPASTWETPELARRLAEYAERAAPLARAGRLGLIDEPSGQTKPFQIAAEKVVAAARERAEVGEETSGWIEKLSLSDARAALADARAYEASLAPLNWLRPGWWRLRKALSRQFDFQSRRIRPRWTEILSTLIREHAATAELTRLEEEFAQKFGLAESAQDSLNRVRSLRADLLKFPARIRELHRQLSRASHAAEWIEGLLEGTAPASSLPARLAEFFEGGMDRPWVECREELRSIEGALPRLNGFRDCLAELSRLPAEISDLLRDLPHSIEELESAIAHHSAEKGLAADREVARFGPARRARTIIRLERLHDQWLESNSRTILREARERFAEHVRRAGLPASRLAPDQAEFKKSYSQGRRELEREFAKVMRFRAIRDLVDGATGMVIRDLKPVWLMSPLSVSDTLPLEDDAFDVVIFDEASQIPLEEATPAIFRGRQAIVVGDEMQLPPTDFFSTRRVPDDDDDAAEDESERQDLSDASFLSHAARALPSTMLGWHYRSQGESLISFSNWAFYDGRLLTVPEHRLASADRKAISVPPSAQSGLDLGETDLGGPDQGANEDEYLAANILDRPLGFHYLEKGEYENRRNRPEAEYIARLTRALLKRGGLSIGIIAFSESQQDEIDQALRRLAQDDDEFRELWEAELDREEDGQFVGLLVKNLENIQGDERDVIILSVCYGPDAQGKMLMNFGPINKSGGEKRLNVAFSRAKRHMVVVSSIKHDRVRNEYNVGANCLKNYLRYSESSSLGDGLAARRVLASLSRWQTGEPTPFVPRADALRDDLAEELQERGYEIEKDVGQSHFRVDLAVRRPGDAEFRLGILLDSNSYYEQADLLERDLIRPRLLAQFGWRVERVFAADWRQDREGTLARVLAAAKKDESEQPLSNTNSQNGSSNPSSSQE